MVALSFKRNIPNFLTILRIILVIPIVILFLVNDIGVAYSLTIDNTKLNIQWNQIIIAILFIIASISDFLDGYLSRKYHLVSNFGKFWDPIADKILINVVFILLAVKNLTHIGFVLVFIIRDILVDGLRMYCASKNNVISANVFGKFKTIFQMIAILILLFFGSYINNVSWWYWGVLNLFVYISVVVSLLSGIVYAVSFKKSLKLTYDSSLSN